MRINIVVPDGDSIVASSSQTSDIDLSDVPAPLLRLAPSNELVLIELQGSLEIDDAHAEGGQVLAKLEFYPDRQDKPTLLISHHRLEGSLVTLTKPFAVLEKKTKPRRGLAKDVHVMRDVDTNSTSAHREAPPSSSPPRFGKPGGAPSTTIGEDIEHLSSEDDDDDDINSHTTPTGHRKRGVAADGADSPTLARKRPRELRDDGETARTNKVSAGMAVPSSSPILAPRMQGSEIDFSSPLPSSKRQVTAAGSALRADGGPHAPGDAAADKSTHDDDDGDDEDWLYKRDTSTYLEVVCIIRRKFIFSKRPEPVVQLDGEGGAKAKAALGLA